MPTAQIAHRLGISRTTVIKAVNSDAPPRYERGPAPTSFTVFEARGRELLVPDRVRALRLELSVRLLASSPGPDVMLKVIGNSFAMC